MNNRFRYEDDQIIKEVDPHTGDVQQTIEPPQAPAEEPKKPENAATSALVSEPDAGTAVSSSASQADAVYAGVAQDAQRLYAQEKAAVDSYAEEQKKLQQEAADLTLQQMEQQKAEAAEDYKKEQSAAYVDYQRQTAKHGVQAEQMASMGMAGTGYHETARMAAYNAYQGRVAVARESYTKLVADYNTAMAEAKLQNSSALAEIAYTALQSGLQLMRQDLETQQNIALARLDVQQAQQLQRAEILAATGDFSGYKALYGLTDEQVMALAASYSQNTSSYAALSSEELSNWEARFKAAKTEAQMQEITQIMIQNGLSPDIAYGLYEIYKPKDGILGTIGSTVSGWWNGLFAGNKTSATSDGDSEAPVVKPW